MTPKDFVDGLYATIVEEISEIYRNLFVNTEIEGSSDPYWKNSLAFFNALSVDQREVFLNVVRQVIVDTTSNVLGIIDGANGLPNYNGEFKLFSDGNELSGDLQNIFLTKEETR